MIRDDDRTTLERFATECADALGASLHAVVVHGDAVVDDGPAGAALTTLLVVDAVTLPLLRRIGQVGRRWRRTRIATPLVLDGEHLARSCDVFPLEILAMMDAHVLIRGERDPFDGLALDHEHLRLEVEQQLRGKLLHLRQEYLEAAGSKRRIRSLMLDSSAGFETIMRGLLLLAGRKRGGAAAICEDVEQALGARLPTFRAVQASRRSGRSPAVGEAETMFGCYLDELASLTRIADRITRP